MIFKRDKKPKLVSTEVIDKSIYLFYTDGRMVNYDTERKAYLVTAIPRL